jgi:hypothetical protein
LKFKAGEPDEASDAKRACTDNEDNKCCYGFFLNKYSDSFSPKFNIRLYDKNSETDFFFPSTKIRIFFSVTLGIGIFV